jgi:hypothetical protein
MEKAFFISERFLKDNTPMGDNVDVKDIYPFARTAEDVYIQEIIGTPRYNRLVESLNASPKNTTTDEITLLVIIRNSLLWYTLYDATPFFWIKFRNIGIVKQNGDNLETVSSSEMDKVRIEFMDKAKFYTKRLVSYLCTNSHKFSHYSGPYQWSDLYPRNSVSSNCDLAFEKKGCCNNDNLKYFG